MIEPRKDPFEHFQHWYAQAGRKTFWRRLLTYLYPPAVIHQPDAMTLATASPDGKPAARIVLFKGLESDGFSFYTNYQSQKGRELENNPRAALVFHWAFPERQVRIEGSVKKLSREQSQDYWQSRPRGSQLSGSASDQSRSTPTRQALVEKVKKAAEKAGSGPIPCPEWWGGFTVIPERIEFWEAKINRLHERLVYIRKDGQWRTEMLEP
jgi:pyridoxamine 5'-phosphate oxidase